MGGWEALSSSFLLLRLARWVGGIPPNRKKGEEKPTYRVVGPLFVRVLLLVLVDFLEDLVLHGPNGGVVGGHGVAVVHRVRAGVVGPPVEELAGGGHVNGRGGGGGEGGMEERGEDHEAHQAAACHVRREWGKEGRGGRKELSQCGGGEEPLEPAAPGAGPVACAVVCKKRKECV